MASSDVHGPIDYILIQFPGDKSLDTTVDAMLALVDSGVVRLYDVMLVQKEDGGVVGIDLSEIADGNLAPLAAFAGARSGMLDSSDAESAAALLDDGSVGLILVYENSWAIPFVGAAMNAGGDAIASARIPADDINQALEALGS